MLGGVPLEGHFFQEVIKSFQEYCNVFKRVGFTGRTVSLKCRRHICNIEKKKKRKERCWCVFLNRLRGESVDETYEVFLWQHFTEVSDAFCVFTRDVFLVDDHHQLQHVTSERHVFTVLLEERNDAYAHKHTHSFSKFILTEGHPALAVVRMRITWAHASVLWGRLNAVDFLKWKLNLLIWTFLEQEINTKTGVTWAFSWKWENLSC